MATGIDEGVISRKCGCAGRCASEDETRTSPAGANAPLLMAGSHHEVILLDCFEFGGTSATVGGVDGL